MKHLPIMIAAVLMCTMCSSEAEWQSVIDNDPDRPEQTPPTETEDDNTATEDVLVKLGVFTDVHYSAAKQTSGGRYYQDSDSKVKEAVATFNAEKVDIAVSLGDIVDNEYEDYEDIGKSLDALSMPLYKILGNHDFITPFDQEQQDAALKVLGIDNRYFSVIKNGFRLIFLDGNDIALYSLPLESSGYRQAEDLYETLKDDLAPNARKYNGAIGKAQSDWLEDELESATSQAQSVVCFCHTPLSLKGDAMKYTLWNGEDVTDLLSSFPCVKAYIAGHHHEGGYASDGNLHHITLKGMVQGEDNSYSIIRLYKDRLVIDGYGRENDKEYKFR